MKVKSYRVCVVGLRCIISQRTEEGGDGISIRKILRYWDSLSTLNIVSIRICNDAFLKFQCCCV